MKTLIIPDIHHKIKLADAIIEKEKGFDKCVFLGDIWDTHEIDNDGPDAAARAAMWVKNKIFDDKYVFLFGNHDLGYAHKNPNLFVSGHTIEKELAIWKVLNAEHFARFKFFWFSQGFFLSHASLHPSFLPPVWKEVNENELRLFLDQQEEDCRKHYLDGISVHWFFLVGDARYRPRRGIPAGGLVWCDAREEFQAIPKLSQIFGHTKMKYPKFMRGDTGLETISSEDVESKVVTPEDDWNIALDCGLKYYAVIDDRQLRVKKSPENFGQKTHQV